jgi:hypothetical protein
MRFVYLLICLFFSSLVAQGQTPVRFKNNNFIISKGDSASVFDPITGAETSEYVPGKPISMNGEQILDNRTLPVHPEYTDSAGNKMKLSSFVFKVLERKLEALDDGDYTLDINNVVVDKAGRLVYYRFHGIKQIVRRPVSSTHEGNKKFILLNSELNDSKIPPPIRKSINSAARDLLAGFPVVESGQKDGRHVNTTGYFNNMTVKDHRVKLNDDYFAL